MFFTQMNQLMNQAVDITLVIRKKEGQLMVSAMPKTNGLKDEAQNHIVPLTVTGTPQELDMGFMQAICQPIQKATGLLTNMSHFEQQADKAAENSKASREQKGKEAKEAKEKKDKFDKHMKKASELETEQKFADALESLKQARMYAIQQNAKSVNDKINAIRMRMNQGSLFGMEQQPIQGNQPPVQPQSPPQQTVPVNQPQPVTNGHNMTAGQTVNRNGYPAATLYPQTTHGQQPSSQYNYAPVHDQGRAEDYIPAPVIEMSADYAVHREGEYDQYPDFPGYSNNAMYNQ